MPAGAAQGSAKPHEEAKATTGMVERMLAFARVSIKGQGRASGQQASHQSASQNKPQSAPESGIAQSGTQKSAPNSVKGTFKGHSAKGKAQRRPEAGMEGFLPFAVQSADAAYADTLHSGSMGGEHSYYQHGRNARADDDAGASPSRYGVSFAHRARRVAVRTTVAADERLRAFLNLHRTTSTAFEDTKVVPDENGALPPEPMTDAATGKPLQASAAAALAVHLAHGDHTAVAPVDDGPQTQPVAQDGEETRVWADSAGLDPVQANAVTAATAAGAGAGPASGATVVDGKPAKTADCTKAERKRHAAAKARKKGAAAAGQKPVIGMVVIASAVLIALMVLLTGGSNAPAPGSAQDASPPVVAAVTPKPQAETASQVKPQVAVPSVMFVPETVNELDAQNSVYEPGSSIAVYAGGSSATAVPAPIASAAPAAPATTDAAAEVATAEAAVVDADAKPAPQASSTLPASPFLPSLPAGTVALSDAEKSSAVNQTGQPLTNKQPVAKPDAQNGSRPAPAQPVRGSAAAGSAPAASKAPPAAAPARSRPKPQRNTLQDIQQRNAQLRRELGLSR